MKKKILDFFIVFFLTSIGLSAQSFKFAAMSDSRGPYNGVNDPVLSTLASHLVESQPDVKFVVFAGDFVNGNEHNPEKTLRELKHWKDVMSPVYNNKRMIWPKIWPVIGNHEVRNRKDEDNFRKVFPNVFSNGPDDEKGLSYSFDFQNSHFAMVNTDNWYYGDPLDTTDDRRDWHYVKHLDWLENDLAAARKRGVEHIFVFSHEMAFPTGGHLRDGLPNLGRHLKLPLDSTRTWYLNRRNKFWDLLKKHHVDAHICGHEHRYARQSVEGVYEIINGSAGAPVYHLNPKYRTTNVDSVYPGDEMSYAEAEKHYKVLNYFYGPGENSQASRNFVGLKAFNYSVYNVQNDSIVVETYGAFPKEKTRNVLDSPIKLIDKFVIKNTATLKDSSNMCK